jgi:hypothetical protein
MKKAESRADLVTAVDMAQSANIDPKAFRAALRAARLRWHQHNAPWAVARGSEEHRDMERVLATIRPTTRRRATGI